METSKEVSEKEKLNKLLDELEWINDDKLLSSDFERIKQKMLKNPLVPLGCLATATVLGMGLANLMNTGSRRRSQMLMRWRVGLQAGTIAALLLGIMYENHIKQGK